MRRKVTCIAVLFLIFAFHVAGNYQVLIRSKVVRICDESARIESGLLYFKDALQNWNGDVLKNSAKFFVLDEAQAHPRFFEAMEVLVLKLLYSTSPIDVDRMIWGVNAIFLFVLLFSVFGIGSIIYNENVGLLAALLISFFPAIFGLSRIAMLDFPLMCMVALSFYLLLKTKEFSSIFFSILFGLVFGMAELTKESAILFVIGPLIYYCTRSYISRKDPKVLINLLTAIVCFFIVSGSLYFRRENFHAYGTYFAKASMRVGRPGAIETFFVWDNALGPGILVLFVLSILPFILKIRKDDKFLPVWFFLPLIMFSMSSNQSIRFVLPVMPAIALIIAKETNANGVFRIHKKGSIAFLILVLLAQYFFINFGCRDGTRLPSNSFDYFSRGLFSVRQDPYFQVSKDLLEVFKSENPGSDSRKTILALYDFPLIHHQMSLEMTVAGWPFDIFAPMEPDDVDILKLPLKDAGEELLSADYVMAKTGYQGSFRSSMREKRKKDFDEAFLEHKNNFVKIAEVKAADHSIVSVYRKIK
jgi:hypothetical protein